MKLIKTFLLVGIVVAIAFLGGCKKHTTSGTVVLNMQANFGSQPLTLDNFYLDPTNQQYIKVETLMIFLSHIYLVKSDNSEVKVSDLHFFNMADPTTLSLSVANVPDGDYTGIVFDCGVDSTTDSMVKDPNVIPDNLLPGAPYMYWLMLRWQFEHIEGLYGPDTSITSQSGMTYHIGGYSNIFGTPVNFYKPASVSTQFSVSDGSTTTKTLTLDFEKLYANPANTVVNINTQSYTQCGTASELAIASAFTAAFPQVFSVQ